MLYVYGKVLTFIKIKFLSIFINTEKLPFQTTEYDLFVIFGLFTCNFGYHDQFSVFLKKDRNAVFYMSRPFHKHIVCKNSAFKVHFSLSPL